MRRAAARADRSCSASIPKPLLDVINPAVDDTLQHVGVRTRARRTADGSAGRRPPRDSQPSSPSPRVEYGLLVADADRLRRGRRRRARRGVRCRAQRATSSRWCCASSAWSPRSWRSSLLARDLHGAVGRTAVMGAVAVDGPALFLQGTDPAARRRSACCSFAERAPRAAAALDAFAAAGRRAARAPTAEQRGRHGRASSTPRSSR